MRFLSSLNLIYIHNSVKVPIFKKVLRNPPDDPKNCLARKKKKEIDYFTGEFSYIIGSVGECTKYEKVSQFFVLYFEDFKSLI